MLVSFFYSPILFHRVWLLSESGHRKERCCKYGRSSSLIYQLSSPPPPPPSHSNNFSFKRFLIHSSQRIYYLGVSVYAKLTTPSRCPRVSFAQSGTWSRTGQWLNLVGEYLEKCYSFYSTVLETGDKGLLISWTMARKYQLCHLIAKLLIFWY